MKIVILDRATLGRDLDISVPIKADIEAYDASPPQTVKERIADADVIFVNKVKLTEENLHGAKSLKLICEAATGYDNIDVAYCAKNGIAVCNVPGYSVYSVAQLTVGTVLYLANRMKVYTGYVSSGEYTKSGEANKLSPVFHELCGLTWGIVGYGNIGKHVASAAKAFGCRILAFKKHPSDEAECVDLDTLIKRSDIITVHLPLNRETRGIITAERVNMIKNRAVFVNAARGAVADEEALCRAAGENRIYFGTDVYSEEPFGTESPYYAIKNRDNVCFTPHMAWGAFEARKRCFNEMILNMCDFFGGGTRNRVDI